MPNNKVFIVHGRNHIARDGMYSFLRALKLQPMTWREAVELTGLASPTTFEIVSSGMDSAQCAVILMTGDDLARLHPDYGDESMTHQPRPNVIFEAGLAMAKSGQKRTILVRFGPLRDLSDLNGLNMVTLDNSPEQRGALIQRLRNAGCEIDTNGIDYLDRRTAGDFTLLGEPEEASPDVLQRGGFTEFLVDSSLSHSISALDLESEVIAYLSEAGTPNLKFNYLGAVGAQNWLNLSDDPVYGHKELEAALRIHANQMIHAMKLDGKRIDFVSLGPGDGSLDLILLLLFQNSSCTVAHYYPLDLSIELLQKTVARIVECRYLNKNFKMKAIHGDFTSLNRYKPIFAFDPAVNFLSLIGYTIGNHYESELLGTIRQGMESGDYLLMDARLRADDGYRSGQRLSKEQIAEITRSYHHNLNNRFAFGPVEATTSAEYRTAKFEYSVHDRFTNVPNALNIVTSVLDLQTRFRRTGRRLNKKKIELAVTTLYDDEALENWLSGKGFDLIWKAKVKGTAFYLLRKTED